MREIRAIIPTQRCLLVLGLALFPTLGMSQDILVVANKAVSASQISSTELRDIYTGTRSHFSDGNRAIPVILKGGPVHEVFLNHYIGENPDEFRTRWRKAVFTGQGAMLKEFGSEAAMLEYVAATPGAIGYCSRIPNQDSVKVLTVWKAAH
jgi:ABC-type phosphate transport system substrate-binding protein